MSQFSEMKSGAEMRNHILGKAAEDAEFRTRLASDPKATLNEEFGVELPDSLAISVYEDSSTHVHLVLPPNSELDVNELKAIIAAHEGGTTMCTTSEDPAAYQCW